MQRFKEFITEMSHSLAILPATRILYNKNKVGHDELGADHKDGTVYAARMHTGSGDKHVFLHSAGGKLSDVKVGTKHFWHHDQTQPGGQRSGSQRLTIDNVIHHKDGKIHSHENDVGVNEKRPVYVFK